MKWEKESWRGNRELLSLSCHQSLAALGGKLVQERQRGTVEPILPSEFGRTWREVCTGESHSPRVLERQLGTVEPSLPSEFGGTWQ